MVYVTNDKGGTVTMSIWFSIFGLGLGLLGVLLLSVHTFKTSADIVSSLPIGRAPVMGDDGSFTNAVAREPHTHQRLAESKKARVGVLLLSAGFLSQLVGTLLTL